MKEESKTLITRALLVVLATSVALSPRVALGHQVGVTEQDSPSHTPIQTFDGGGGSGQFLNMRLSFGPIDWEGKYKVSVDARLQFASCGLWNNAKFMHVEISKLTETGEYQYPNDPWQHIWSFASATPTTCTDGLYTRHLDYNTPASARLAVRVTHNEDQGLPWDQRRVYVIDSDIPPLPPSTCQNQGFAFSEVIGISDDQGVSVRFKWAGDTAIGWNVYYPSPNVEPFGTPKFDVPPEQLVGYNSSYGATDTVTTTATDFLISYKADESCYVEGTFNDTDGTGDEITDETGAACGRWNLLCWMKAAALWAFKPTEASSNAWNDTKELLKTKTPFKEVHEGGKALDLALQGASIGDPTGIHPAMGTGCLGAQEEIPIPGFCIRDSGIPSESLFFIRLVTGAAVFAAFLFRVWSSAVGLVGGRGTDPSYGPANTGVQVQALGDSE